MLTQTPETRKLLEDIQRAHSEYEATALNLKVRRDWLRHQIQSGREAGLTLAQIGELLGVSRQRVDQMLKS